MLLRCWKTWRDSERKTRTAMKIRTGWLVLQGPITFLLGSRYQDTARTALQDTLRAGVCGEKDGHIHLKRQGEGIWQLTAGGDL